MENSTKFKVGSLARIAARLTGHHFKIGEIVTLESDGLDGIWRCRSAENPNSDVWYVSDEEMELPKSRLAEILGVEEDEEWEYDSRTFRIHNGIRYVKMLDSDWRFCSNEAFLTEIINNSYKIIHKKTLTAEEIARCRAFGAKYVTMDNTDTNAVFLWSDKPKYDEHSYSNPEFFILRVDNSYFPSVNRGDCIKVPEN